jgi:elongation factor Tu
MSAPFFFFDELRAAGEAPVRVLARVKVLSAEEGGRTSPFQAKSRPNHNFGGPENRYFYIGQVEIPEGESVAPGETRELMITFLPVIGIVEELKLGRRWRIQEGGKLVAFAEVLAVNSESPN